MLLGYDKEGNIKFIFTDEKYLNKMYPNNTAKINNFWGNKHNLTEFFIPKLIFKDWENYKNYKIINQKLSLKENKSKIKTSENTTPIEVTKNINIANNQTIKLNKGE